MSDTAASPLLDIARALVAGCREGREAANLDTLYAPDAVSVEAMPMQGGGSAETHGVEGIKAKHAWWNQTFDVTSAEVEGPFPHQPDRFAVIFRVEARNRQTGEDTSMQEVAVYTVKDGRIVREEFFYGG